MTTNRWYPYDSRAEHWRVQRVNILTCVAIGLLQLGLAFFDLAEGITWWLTAILFIAALLTFWTTAGILLCSGSWLKPWVPFCEKPNVRARLESLEALEKAIAQHREGLS